MILANIWCK